MIIIFEAIYICTKVFNFRPLWNIFFTEMIQSFQTEHIKNIMNLNFHFHSMKKYESFEKLNRRVQHRNALKFLISFHINLSSKIPGSVKKLLIIKCFSN